MKIKSPTLQALRFAEPIYALALLAWFFGPLLFGWNSGFNPLQLATVIIPEPGAALWLRWLIQIMVWLVPILAVWKIASFFLADILPAWCEPSRSLPILFNVLASAIILITQIMHAAVKGSGIEYFATYHVYLWCMTGLSLVWNAIATVALIRSFSSRDSSWGDYQEFQKAVAENKGSLFQRLGHWGIQKRLVVSFIAIIFIVIAVLGYVLLRDFSNTIMAAVQQSGLNLTEQTANVIKSSAGDSIASVDFMIAQDNKNQSASFPFNSLTYWQFNSKTNSEEAQYSTVYIEDNNYNEKAAKTTQATTADAKLTQSLYRNSVDGTQLEFLSPVILGGKNIGYVKAIYEQSIILRPFYQTQFKVFLIAAIFLYLAIFVTYLFGRNIVIPILFLRMSVNTISRMLSEMIRGQRKINIVDLQYQDRVKTRDEIKSLSTEIGNMATVIRGVIPYISASTLKAAERDSPSSEKRDLCFLFTDIRGFTTLCEGLEPDEVVNMLNHFLELQSSIILANNGDIDKFVGDEIMAMFEGPDKELNACRASIGIRSGMAREKELAEAAQKNVVSIGIGINTGPVVFGSVGAQDRMDFTSIGDTVNLAARLEGANKPYGTKTLITEAVWNHVKEEFLCREIDFLTVKGKSLPVRVFEVLQERATAKPRLVEMAANFEKGLVAYRAQDWDKAEEIFLDLAKEFSDETSKIFLNRVSIFRKDPPLADWDGVFNLTAK